MNVVILGCGRTGATLALELSSRGHKVTIIERNPESLRRLGKEYPCRIVLGNGLDEDVISKAGIEKADAFFAVTRGDNTNLMAAHVVRSKYKLDKVCVKVADPQRADAYRKMGLFCINASALLSGMCRHWLTDEPYLPINEYNILAPELKI
ncbi:MAG TPA: TrkA family potassium uptake protein [Fimbriimonadaceae bacterium]|nr:TrkA family potassium uptake protein [Fimbriimonadaceae bacterium]